VEDVVFGKSHVLKKHRKTQAIGNEQIDDIVKKSDLQPAVYEGGFKLWECAIDLLNYFVERSNPIQFEGKRVLEVLFSRKS
jgi:hypothetical protein